MNFVIFHKWAKCERVKKEFWQIERILSKEREKLIQIEF